MKMSGQKFLGSVRPVFEGHPGKEEGVWIPMQDYKSPRAVVICDTLVNTHTHTHILLVEPVELKIAVKPNTMH